MSADPVEDWYADKEVHVKPSTRIHYLGWRHHLYDPWLAWAAAVLALAVGLGLFLSARGQAEALRGELRELEGRCAEQTRQLALANSSCIAEVRPTPSGWQLIRADGSDGGTLSSNPAAAAPDAAAGVPRMPMEVVPPKATPSGAGQGAPPIRVGGTGGTAGEFADLMCRDTPRIEWAEVKVSALDAFGTWNAGIVPRGKQQMRNILDTAMLRLQAVQGLTDECGMGRLCMSLLAVLTGDMETSLQGAKALHAPLLSLLLEMPWSLTVWSGWPLFALLAQLHLHIHGRDDLPTSKREKEYFLALQEGLEKNRPAALARAGAAFLEARANSGGKGSDKDQSGAGAHAMPVLCALASQLLGDDLSNGGRGHNSPTPDAEEALRHVQGFFRQSVQSIEDLHASAVSAWPLYGILHAATLALNGSVPPEV